MQPFIRCHHSGVGRVSVLTIAGPPAAAGSGMPAAVVLLQTLQELGWVSSLRDLKHRDLLCCWLRLRGRLIAEADDWCPIEGLPDDTHGEAVLVL
ncbi:hypothetical protein E2C01_008133 [Portunus trituberculatus]|uniref:Uncharacterized protein n=1 Tax=Portunus trituberculatus TaxID=210409 RepID=A0A5B7D411_PORTR|nr:hypothetical protein [Portunus trituberculatus]